MSATSSGPHRDPVRVIYVAGCGRSGSTVLDTLLGHHPSISGLGEMQWLPGAGWAENGYCACGHRADACPFWSKVRKRWERRLPEMDITEYKVLEERFTRRRAIPRLLLEARVGTRSFQRYADATLGVFRSVRDVSGRPAMVDSSKSPGRALALSLMPGIDLRVIHLIRDGRGVLWSLKKSFEKNESQGLSRTIRPKPTWRSAGLWTIANLLAEGLRATAGSGRFVQLRYEDLVADPAGAMATLSPVVGLDLSRVGDRAAGDEPFTVGHNIAGNRLRMQETLRLRPDLEWRNRLPAGDRRLFGVLTAPLLVRYGYMGVP